MWQIRPAQQQDHDAILALWDAAGMGRTAADEWQAITSGPCATLLVAEEGAALLGAAVASFDGWRAYISHVAIAPAQRRRGLAKAVMAEGEQHLRRRGARRVYALVNQDNTAGLALCAASGYEPLGDVGLVKELGA